MMVMDFTITMIMMITIIVEAPALMSAFIGTSFATPVMSNVTLEMYDDDRAPRADDANRHDDDLCAGEYD